MKAFSSAIRLLNEERPLDLDFNLISFSLDLESFTEINIMHHPTGVLYLAWFLARKTNTKWAMIDLKLLSLDYVMCDCVHQGVHVRVCVPVCVYTHWKPTAVQVVSFYIVRYC